MREYLASANEDRQCIDGVQHNAQDSFEPIDLAVQERVKCAFDPGALLNPGKVFPSLSACVEGGAMHVHGGRMPFPNLSRL